MSYLIGTPWGDRGKPASIGKQRASNTPAQRQLTRQASTTLIVEPTVSVEADLKITISGEECRRRLLDIFDQDAEYGLTASYMRAVQSPSALDPTLRVVKPSDAPEVPGTMPPATARPTLTLPTSERALPEDEVAQLAVPPMTARPALTMPALRRPFKPPPMSAAPKTAPSSAAWPALSVLSPKTPRSRRHPRRHHWLGPLPDGRAATQALIDLSRTLELPPYIATATQQFTARHREHVSSSGGFLRQLSHRPDAIGAARRFDRTLDEVRRNRLYDDAHPEEKLEFYRSRRAKRLKWALETSIWAPRMQTGNAQAFYEVDEAMERTFQADWSVVAPRIRKLLSSCHAQMSGGGQSIEEYTAQVRAALFAEWRLLYGAFDYYATLSAMDNELHNVYHVSSTAFLKLVRSCGLVTPTVTRAMHELIFIKASVVEKGHEHASDRYNRPRHLNRQQWMRMLVYVALELHPKVAQRHLAEAVTLLLRHDLAPHLPPEALQRSDCFREHFCYLERVDRVLREHEASLRALFGRYSDLNVVLGTVTYDHKGFHTATKIDSTQALSCGEWMALLEHLGLLETGMLSEFDAKLVFCWSRMRVVDGHTDKDVQRMRHLFFEDFLEALVRLAGMVALPTDEEVRAAGAADAGEFLISLEAAGSAAFRQFVEMHRQDWKHEPKQSIWRCVSHLLSYIVRTVETNQVRDHARKDLTVTRLEASDFAEQFTVGHGQHQRRSLETSLVIHSEELVAQMGAIRQKLLGALATVKVFANFTESERSQLLDAMSEAPFNAGELVFEEGAQGDAFYIVISGSAQAIKAYYTDEEEVLAELGEGACFGERALLRDEPRFATIIATSRLRAMRITRGDFEASFGSLAERLPDDYD